MLSRKIPKLRLDLNSKGKSSAIHYYNKYKRYLQNGIPVLSIFALVGILSQIINLTTDFIETNQAYAEEGISPQADTSTSASLTVDDGKIKDTIFATNGEFAYSTHKVSINATNVKAYTLTLSKTKGLTGPSNVADANNTTPANMDNMWGYAWIDEGIDPASDNANYNAITASTNLANSTNIDTNHNVSYSKQLVFGAKFGNSAANGTYSAEATLSLVATPRVVVNYTLTYNGNASGVSNVPTTTTTSDDTGATSKSFTLSNTTPTRAGYIFLGWADNSSATAAQYQAGGTINIPASNPSKIIYAIWKQDLNWNSITTMQQMTPEICAEAAVGATKTLTDTRDNNTYVIRKHEDKNCWMTQNLRLIGSRSLSTNDTNIEGNWTLPNTIIGSGTSVSGWGSTNSAIQSAYFGNTTNGVYYSWCAATASSCTDDASTPIAANTNAALSICPKGWQLPSMNGGLSYNSFLSAAGIASTAAGSTTIRNSTYGFIFAGDIDNGSLGLEGARGRYWSSTAQNNDQAYNLAFDNTYVGSAGAAKRNGLPIRCVAIAPITYTLSYAYGSKYDSGLPQAQTITLLGKSHTFTIPSNNMVFASSNGCGGPVLSYTGSDGATYTPGQSITLTETNPSFTLTIKSVNESYCI